MQTNKWDIPDNSLNLTYMQISTDIPAYYTKQKINTCEKNYPAIYLLMSRKSITGKTSVETYLLFLSWLIQRLSVNYWQ